MPQRNWMISKMCKTLEQRLFYPIPVTLFYQLWGGTLTQGRMDMIMGNEGCDGRTTKVARNHSLSIMERLIISIAYRAIGRYPSSFPFHLCHCRVCYVCTLGRSGGRGGVERIRERRRSGSISEYGGRVWDEEWDDGWHFRVERGGTGKRSGRVVDD